MRAQERDETAKAGKRRADSRQAPAAQEGVPTRPRRGQSGQERCRDKKGRRQPGT